MWWGMDHDSADAPVVERSAGGRWPGHRRAWVTATAITATVAGAVATRARLRNWGATPEEIGSSLPGDDLLTADSASTRAIIVGAPCAEVWPWLVQIGQDRGGWYSYDWLENLFGLDIHSTDDLHGEWQHLTVGDVVRATPPGATGLPEGYAFRVALVDPPRALVLRQRPPEHPWNATWAFVLADDGPDRCRLLVRSRSTRSPGLAGRLSGLVGELLDPITLLMTRRMLLGIRERAERAHARGLPSSMTRRRVRGGRSGGRRQTGEPDKTKESPPRRGGDS